MTQKSTMLLLLAVAFLSLQSMLPNRASAQQMQNRRVLVEEQTGSWCGWCPRGALALKQLDETYPGQVVGVAVHGGSTTEPMHTAQGDSITAGTGGPQGATPGYPNGWVARNVFGTSWNIDPMNWIDTLNATGAVDQLMGQASDANVSVDNIHYDDNAGTITCRVNVTFNKAMTGDLRFNLYVVEDSVTGSGNYWLQHNYYYHRPGYETSPYYSVGSGAAGNATIAGYVYNHVFREAVPGIWGLKGVISNSVSAGSKFSQVFTFAVPSNVDNINHAQLIGFVHKFSATDISKNEVLDVEEDPVIGTAPKTLATRVTTEVDNQYATAKAGGDTTLGFTITNNGTEAVTFNIAVDPNAALPTGWTASVTPSTVTIDPGKQASVNAKVSASQQAAFTAIRLLITPVKAGYLVSHYMKSAYFLSDNTKYALYVGNGLESAAYLGLPAAIRPVTSVMPLTTDVVQSYGYANFDGAIFDNITALDYGVDPGFGTAPALPIINDMLDAGRKVFVSSYAAMFYAFYSPDVGGAGNTGTQALQDFFNLRLGLSWTKSVQRWNSSTGASISWNMKGVTSDPISNGIAATNSGGTVTEIYSIDSNSTPLFYSDNNTKFIVGSKYEDPATHGRIVFLGFNLSGLTEQTIADTIMGRSMQWLLSPVADAGVEQPKVALSNFSSAANPFHSSTQISYTAAEGEHDVTFAAFDLLGREIAKMTPKVSGSTVTATFDANGLAAGTYVIVKHSSTGSQELRVVSE